LFVGFSFLLFECLFVCLFYFFRHRVLLCCPDYPELQGTGSDRDYKCSHHAQLDALSCNCSMTFDFKPPSVVFSRLGSSSLSCLSCSIL
jgi:hypothetical protein